MFSSKSIFVYCLMVLAFMFMMLYIWRRIYGLECYAQILEKKVNNLRKENKDLQCLLNEPKQCSFSDADIILNEIFCDSKSSKKCTQNSTKASSSPKPTSIVDDVQIKVVDEPVLAEHIDNSKDSLEDLVNINELANVVMMTVDSDKPQDNESVISDANGVYNKKKLSKFNLEKLKEICTSIGLSNDGTKNTLIDRILNSQ